MDRHDSVIIKSNAYGLILILDPAVPFEQLKADCGHKFSQAARFFRNAQMALTFKGRRLSEEEQVELLETITENAQIQIVCIVDEDKENAEEYKKAMQEALENNARGKAMIYDGSLRNGQTLEGENSIVILGDVNPGAKVVAGGNVIILGCCMGQVAAGAGGNEHCFVAAHVLKPNTLRIASMTARSAITKRVDNGEYPLDPRIAYLKDGHLNMEKLTSDSFAKLPWKTTKDEKKD